MDTFKNYRKWHLSWSKALWWKPNHYLISLLRYFIFNDINRWYTGKRLIHLATFNFHKDLYETNKKLSEYLDRRDNLKLMI